jgi:hypothetical protein
MHSLLAIVQTPPLDIGFLEVLAAIVISAAILAVTGKKLREDIRRWTGV